MFEKNMLFKVTVASFVLVTSAWADPSVTLKSITPQGALVGDVPLLQLSGSGFREDCQVMIGNQACADLRLVDGHTIYCRVPQSAKVQQVDVSLQCSEGNAALKGGFYYYNPLTITGATAAAENIPVIAEIDGGVKPYKVDPNQYEDTPTVTLIDDSHAKVTAPTAGYSTYQYNFTMIDAIGNKVTQNLMCYSAIGKAFAGVPTAVGPGYTLALPQLGGLNATPLQITSGGGQIIPMDKGQVAFEAGTLPGTTRLESHDDLGQVLQFDVKVVSEGYQADQFSFHTEDRWQQGDSTMILTMMGDKVLYLDNTHDDKSFGQIIRFNGTLPDDSWGFHGVATDPKLQWYILYSGAQPTPDGRLYVSGQERKVHWFSNDDYGVTYLVRYTADGQLDKKFNPNFHLSNEANITGISLRTDGKLWVSATSCNDDLSKCQGLVYLINDQGKFELKMELPGSPSQVMLTGDTKDGIYLATDGIQGTYLDHFGADGKLDDAFRKNALATMNKGTGTFQLVASSSRLYVGWKTVIPPDPNSWDPGSPTQYNYYAHVFGSDGWLVSGFEQGDALKQTSGQVAFDASSNLVTPTEKVLSSGALDANFGNGGKTIYPVTTNSTYYPNQVSYSSPQVLGSTVAPDGTIYQLLAGDIIAKIIP